jgi:hypothetical protein
MTRQPARPAAATPTTMVGVFEERAQARGALEELQREGFPLDRLGLVSDSDGLVDQVGALAAADVADRGLADVLVGMGVPRTRADRYARHLAAARTIVTVAVPAGRPPGRAARVLRRRGVRELSR